MNTIDYSGQFWTPDNSDHRVDGLFHRQVGSTALVNLNTKLIPEKANPYRPSERGIAYVTCKPADIVEDGRPHTILGDTEYGPVSCVNALLKHPEPSPINELPNLVGQRFETQTAVLGAHLPEGSATKLKAIRMMIDHPMWWAHLADEEAAKSSAGSVSYLEATEGEWWIEFTPASEFTLGASERTLQSMDALIRLALDRELTHRRLQVLLAEEHEWLEVLVDGADASATHRPTERALLPPNTMTLERISRWLEMEQTMDGLATAVAIPVEDKFIQVQGIVACSLVEGIHKRLVTTKEIDFIERAEELEKKAQEIQEDLTAGIEPLKVTKQARSPWSKLVKTVRNDLAHHNTTRKLEVQLLEWLLVAASVHWVLRLCLLDEAGFSHDDIRKGLSTSRKYEFYCAYADAWIKERDVLVSR